MLIKTKYNIGQEVYIKPAKLLGRIISIFVQKNSIEYNLRFFIQSEPKTCYFLEDELQLTEDEKTVGFQSK